MAREKIDIIGLQETVKTDFSNQDFQEISGMTAFYWFCLPAKGRSGGILIGVKGDSCEVEDHEVLEFCIMLTLRMRKDNFRWHLVVVYGPAQRDLADSFLLELGTVCSKGVLPLVIGGDFNLIRFMEEKNSDNYNFGLMDSFNAWIGDFQLREIKRAGPKHTWTNKQSTPVLVTLDRCLMSPSWEEKFPLCSAWSLTRVGSDHCPIILDSGEDTPPRTRYFFFENQWTSVPEFMPLVQQKWLQSKERRPELGSALDAWHGSLCLLRQFMKGWNIQKSGEQKKEKNELLLVLESIDAQAEKKGVNFSRMGT